MPIETHVTVDGSRHLVETPVPTRSEMRDYVHSHLDDDDRLTTDRIDYLVNLAERDMPEARRKARDVVVLRAASLWHLGNDWTPIDDDVIELEAYQASQHVAAYIACTLQLLYPDLGGETMKRDFEALKQKLGRTP